MTELEHMFLKLRHDRPVKYVIAALCITSTVMAVALPWAQIHNQIVVLFTNMLWLYGDE